MKRGIGVVWLSVWWSLERRGEHGYWKLGRVNLRLGVMNSRSGLGVLTGVNAGLLLFWEVGRILVLG